MMDCKKALDDTGGDMEAAVDALRAKGLAAAAKKSSRTAAEGWSASRSTAPGASRSEVNSETDFVAKNEQFQDFVRKDHRGCAGAGLGRRRGAQDGGLSGRRHVGETR
jgi:elongation factor Ts